MTYVPSMTLLRIDASVRGPGSASKEIADIVVAEWQAAKPGDTVITRHLGTDPLPSDLWGPAVTASWTPAEHLSDEQKAGIALAKTLFDELAAADAVVLAFPLYNYGPSQHAKAWIDMIIADPRSENGSAQLLAGKKVVLVTSRGGSYAKGTPREGWDLATPFYSQILKDVWGADLTVIEREFTLVGVNPAMDGFKVQGAAEHEKALQGARDAGKALGV